MRRMFDEHIKRKVVSLDGIWDFKLDSDNIGKENKWYMGLSETEIANIPSVWNIEKGLLSYEGIIWYQKTFFTHGGTLNFLFDGIMTECEVWLDGNFLGTHYGGFCEFDFVVRDINEGYHQLVIRVDNTFKDCSIPKSVVDWYHYGGIIRSVQFQELDGISILKNMVDYKLDCETKSVSYNFIAELYNSANNTVTSEIKFELGNNCIYTESVTLKPGEKLLITTPVLVEFDVRIWDAGKPELYDIKICSDTDDLFDRIGFRKIEALDGKILLNNKEIELHGVNRHEEHPEFGFAFPQSLMKRDIDIIKEMGCNAIRGSHYPNSRLFVDMLDYYGILFWSEIPMWGAYSEEVMENNLLVERGLEMHKEMVERYYNHPSIIIWGMHNEIKSDTTSAYKMTQKFYKFLKENGGNRLVTYATDKPMTDVCFKLCDIICINQYYGWYYGDLLSWNKFLNEFRVRREELGFSNKPVVMSEFGCAAIYGNHTFDNIKWSEEYQAELLSHCVRTFHSDPMVKGFYIWQYCDMRTCEQAGINRARGFNNKGILNEYRKPKLAYSAIKNDYENFKSK